MTCQAVHMVDHACQLAAITHCLYLHLQGSLVCAWPACHVQLPHTFMAGS